jgi:hypothetical protein
VARRRSFVNNVNQFGVTGSPTDVGVRGTDRDTAHPDVNRRRRESRRSPGNFKALGERSRSARDSACDRVDPRAIKSFRWRVVVG